MIINVNDNVRILSPETVDESAVEQVKSMADSIAFKGSRIRVMPDYHAGKGSVIGFTATFNSLIIPNTIGVDIGCGVLAYNLGKHDNIDFGNFDSYIRREIPLGCKHRTEYPEGSATYNYFSDQVFYSLNPFLCEYVDWKKREFNDTGLQLGTLGGGNHFLEVSVDHDQNLWVLIHSGSRNFGLKIASIFQDIAHSLCQTMKVDVPKDLEYLPLDLGGKEYLYWMDKAQRFAFKNRMVMLGKVLGYFDLTFNSDNMIESVHNYIDLEQKIIRKGAIKCMKDTDVLIPLNMRDGTIIARGKDNEKLKEWNFSMPHGAGRKLSRTQAKESLSLAGFQESMKGIWSSSISGDTLDESPDAYKDSEEVWQVIKDLVYYVDVLKPVYNIKASE